MKIKLAIHLSITACAITSLSAATVDISNRSGVPSLSRVFVDSFGTVLGEGFAAIGYFSTLSDFSTSSGLDLENDFNVLGNAATDFTFTGFGAANAIPGIVEFSASESTPNGSGFIGNNIFLIVSNATTLAASTEAFIMEFATSFAEDPSAPVNFDLSNPITPGAVVFGADNANADVFIGTTNTGTINNAYQTAVLVPEPSTLILSTIGLIALFRRKR